MGETSFFFSFFSLFFLLFTRWRVSRYGRSGGTKIKRGVVRRGRRESSWGLSWSVKRHQNEQKKNIQSRYWKERQSLSQCGKHMELLWLLFSKAKLNIIPCTTKQTPIQFFDCFILCQRYHINTVIVWDSMRLHKQTRSRKISLNVCRWRGVVVAGPRSKTYLYWLNGWWPKVSGERGSAAFQGWRANNIALFISMMSLLNWNAIPHDLCNVKMHLRVGGHQSPPF